VRIGGHVSVAGGLVNGIANAKRIGADTIQIFGSSPRQWQVRLPRAEDASAFRAGLKQEGIGPVFLHAPYLVNLANPSASARETGRKAMIGHLQIAEMVGAKGLIFHIGSGAELPGPKAFAAVVGEMKKILSAVPGKSHLILENSAGGGNKIGGTLEDIGQIARAVGSPRVSVCFDTAHAFESGLVRDYSAESVRELSRRIGRAIGWEGFRNLLREPNFRKLPWLLEVPGSEGMPDKPNVDILRKLARG
jgi:deoxyribonuclease IV